MLSRRTIRSIALALLLTGTVLVGTGAISAGDSPSIGASIDPESRLDGNVTTAAIPEGAEVTVVSTQGFFASDENADLFAVTRNGEIVYHDASRGVYFDVDPTERRWTVEYVAAAERYGEECTEIDVYQCTLNVIERVNLSTGETERVYAEYTPELHSTRWHDADRINDTHVALADIYRDSVRIVDVRSDETVWEWNATRRYDYGEDRPQDWTHINDVEVLDDGTLLVSVRNMDEVVFLDPGSGVLANRTLGEQGNHAILYAQHNPDYIPEERGGPAILLSDSENNRVVEYQRANGEWQRSWTWRDARLQWPRDADRLPNGRTLVVDSHGDRVLEVAPNGSVIWRAHVGMPYDAERLGSGPESSGGRAMRGLAPAASAGIETPGPVGELLIALKDRLPAVWVNGALYVAPAWVRFPHLVVLAGMGVVLVTWTTLEYRWASWSVTSPLRST